MSARVKPYGVLVTAPREGIPTINHANITVLSIQGNVERVDAVMAPSDVPEQERHVTTSLGTMPVVKIIKKMTSVRDESIEKSFYGPGNLLLRKIAWHAVSS